MSNEFYGRMLGLQLLPDPLLRRAARREFLFSILPRVPDGTSGMPQGRCASRIGFEVILDKELETNEGCGNLLVDSSGFIPGTKAGPTPSRRRM